MSSQLKLYSLGIVVRDKLPGDDNILVTAIEVNNMQESGKVLDSEKTHESGLRDNNGGGFDASIKTSNYFTAKWIPDGSDNRLTAPDVCEGEQVAIYQYGDVQKFYWRTIFREPALRKLETVVYSWSNNPTRPTEPSLTTSYVMLMDARNGKVRFTTPNNNGEATKYTIQIDTKKGVLNLEDAEGNTVVLDSAAGSLTANINTSVSVTAGESILLKAPNITLDGEVMVTKNLVVRESIKSSKMSSKAMAAPEVSASNVQTSTINGKSV